MNVALFEIKIQPDVFYLESYHGYPDPDFDLPLFYSR